MRNAKQILQGALKEINGGHWICGELCALPTGANPESGTSVTDQKDVMGCALGLVAIYGEDLESNYIQVQGVPNPNYDGTDWAVPYWSVEPRGVTMLTARYADTNSPKAVIKAIKALNAALPKNKQITYPEGLEGADLINALNEIVYEYNDNLKYAFKTEKGRTNAARRWFEKAIDLLPTVDAKLNTVETRQIQSLTAAF